MSNNYVMTLHIILNQGVILLVSLGNILVFLTFANSQYNITTLSNPTPAPPI